MTRIEIKARAKAQLGNSIFGNIWMMAVVVVLVQSLLSNLINAVPGVGSVASLILSGPIAYGAAALFLRQTRDGQAMNVSDLFNGFKTDFGGTCVLGLMITIFTFLWSLLFVIPGIVKSYAYSMAYYIKVDHPEYDWKKCMDQSQAMMMGHKMELFIQDLSFIGWIIVGSLCCGVGILWVDAYMMAGRSQFYENLRLQASAF